MLFISILSILFSNAVAARGRRDLAILYNRIGVITLIYSILHSVISFSIVIHNLGIHGGLLRITTLTQIFTIFLFGIATLILVLISYYPWRVSDFGGEQFQILEYSLLLLFVILGGVFLISTNDLVSIFLSIELQSYGLYLLSTIFKNSELSTTGGLIYFLLGGLTSCFILLGTSLLYANSGTTSLDGLFIISRITDISDSITTSWYKSYYIKWGLLILSIGFLFKVSAAPFHFWSPDVYDAIPTIVTTFVAIIGKISVFIFFLELVYYTGGSAASATTLLQSSWTLPTNWTIGLLVSSLLSLIVGAVVGLTQFRIKRLLAYSTISHVGYILLALSISSVESTQAFIFYLIQYTISNLNAFIILVTIGYIRSRRRRAYSRSRWSRRWSSRKGVTPLNEEYKGAFTKEEILDHSPVQLISQLKGYFYVNSLLSLSLAITIFSFLGIPPLVGFFAKQMVLSAALDNGYIFLSLIAILTSVIGGVYYLNIIKEIFFFSSVPAPAPRPRPSSSTSPSSTTPWVGVESEYDDEGESEYDDEVESFKFNTTTKNITISTSIAITISIITLILLFFIFINKEWLRMCTIMVQILFNN